MADLFVKVMQKNPFSAGLRGLFVQSLLSGFSPRIWAVSLLNLLTRAASGRLGHIQGAMAPSLARVR